MKAHEIDQKLRDADRFSAQRLPLRRETGATPWPTAGRRRRGLFGVAGLAAAAVATAVILLLGGGTSESPSRAYGAALVRFAESTPLLLLEGPDWRVQNVFQAKGREGLEGSIEFVTGKPIPYESIRMSGPATRPRESGMFPPAMRQRRVDLSWSRRSLEGEIARVHAMLHPHGRRVVELPVLDTTASVDIRAEFFVNQGGPGNRQMIALWSEDGYTLEMRAAVPDLRAFEERLDWLTKVDSETWLDAMPAKVVKAADHDATVHEMLEGIPVPATFKPSRVPDEGLTTNRYQVGAAVTGTVSCLWFRQWGQARRTGDRAAAAEAEKTMATSRRWPILGEITKDGAYPNMVWELAADMPNGYWEWNEHRHRLLPRAEGLGCAHRGIPVLPWKQKRQNELFRRGAGGEPHIHRRMGAHNGRPDFADRRRIAAEANRPGSSNDRGEAEDQGRGQEDADSGADQVASGRFADAVRSIDRPAWDMSLPSSARSQGILQTPTDSTLSSRPQPGGHQAEDNQRGDDRADEGVLGGKNGHPHLTAA